eukprot:gb/GFBE01056294.1/.p1 GENE.gb/GFBE01056294.1/~~gb/GFBE01056294.1/.p1  ORF type:complete len:266 (+),score=49.62 gb/GFBE01056294.1/:1-798(+)
MASAKVDRLRSWLSTARCRLRAEDYTAFRAGLQQLQKLRETKDGSLQELLLALATILWRAEFPESVQKQLRWLNSFGDTLPPSLTAAWVQQVRSAAPAHVLPLPADEAEHAEESATPLAADTEPPTGGAVSSTARPEPQKMGPMSLLERSEVFLAKASQDLREAMEEGHLPPQRRVRRRLSEESDVEVVGAKSNSGEVQEQPSGKEPRCIICHFAVVRPEVAVLCGHVACQGCWKKWLPEKLECPVCRNKVRRKNLVLLKGWGDG